MKEEQVLFSKAFPCNSYPFLKRIEELLKENRTNSLMSLKGKELDKAKSCLFILIGQAYRQLFTIESIDEFERPNKSIDSKEKTNEGRIFVQQRECNL